MSGPGCVLAIGIDAVPLRLVSRLVHEGAMPRLRALQADGVSGRVTSPADVGSGAVWPTFWTGRPVQWHQVYASWAWSPEAMDMGRVKTDHLMPFWGPLAQAGHRIAVLDVPFAPVLGIRGGIEVSEWGPHDRLHGRLRCSPAEVAPLVASVGGVHPFAAGAVEAAGPGDAAGLSRLAARCLLGVRQRGRLAVRLGADGAVNMILVVFSEVHRAAHYLWHTVEPAGERAAAPAVSGPLSDLLREVDGQIGTLVDAAGPGASVLVFSLHGMRPTSGVPTILDPLLSAWGLGATKGWRAGSWADRVRAIARRVKGRVPRSVKRLLHRPVARAAMTGLTRIGLIPAYDWQRTRVFALPTDQHGWLRVNLAGREAQGIVPPGAYAAECRRVVELLRGAVTADGPPLVDGVLLGASAGGDPPRSLPDVIVHWSEAAGRVPLRVRTPAVSAWPAAAALTGQHDAEGFFVWRPGRAALPEPPSTLAAEDLHRLLVGALDVPSRRG